MLRCQGSLKTIRSLSVSATRNKQIKEGYWIVHGRHQLKYWENDTKIKKVESDSGHMLELPEYTIRPFKMKNLGGRQPDTELAKVNVVEGEGAYGSLENKDSPRIRPSRGERGIQVESNSDVNDCNLPRTGYIIDLYRMSHELRNQNKIYKEKIIKIVEDHSACRHLALVVGKDRPMRWIPATASMQVGQIISNDPTGRVLDPDEVIEGNSYKAAALPVGTKVSFVEKIPGMGASLAMSSGRYGIITGRINRSNADPLILVSFPYASPDGYTMEYESASGEMHHTANSKGTVDEKGLHQRMGGDDVWKNDILKLGMKSYRNKMEKASQSNPEQKSYFNRMATHRESRQEQNPQSLYDQDYALNAECVVTVGVASDGGLFNARLLSQIGTPHLLYGGKDSPGHRNKLIRKSGKQHITSYWRKFKRPAGQMVNIHGNRFGLLQE